MNKPFSTPERQSEIGVLVIFLAFLYNVIRGLWVFGIYLIVGDTSKVLIPALIGLGVIAVLAFIYSILYYRNFKFHIDYQQQEFVLQKGVFSTEFINLPFDKIQQVYFKRSLIQRAINVYEVAVDTAGSSKKEITIKALSKEKADALRSILMNFATEETISENEVESDSENVCSKASAKWEHHLDIPTLVKIGLTSNYLRGVWLIFLFFGTIMNELNQVQVENKYYDEAILFLNENFNTSTGILIALSVALVATFIVGMLITFVETFVKYFDLKLKQTKDSLDLQMGLKTNTRISLKPRRVQLLRLSTNPIQKRLNLHEAEVKVASSSDQLQNPKSKIKIPGLEKEKLTKIRDFLYDQPEESSEKIKPHPLLLVRRMIFSLIPLAVAFIPIIIFSWYKWSFLIPFTLIYILLIYILNKKYYQSISIQFTENFIIKNHGIWTQEVEILELYKQQSITVKQPIWYRRRGLYNLIFHTAGGDLSFPLIKEDALKALNYGFYKIETSKKAWM